MSKPLISETKLEWASASITDPGSGQDNKVEPPGATKTNGWVFLQKPPFNWFNYWMNLVYQYLYWIVTEPLEGVFTFTGNKTFTNNVTINGSVSFTDTTSSTDKDTGSLVLDGGLGVEENINAGGTIKTIDTTSSTNKDTGSIVTEGGLGVEENINAGGDINAIGDMTAENMNCADQEGTSAIILVERTIAGQQVFNLHKPISAYLLIAVGGSLDIEQGGAYQTIAGASAYSLMLNPGKYRIVQAGAGTTRLYITGVFGSDDVNDASIVTLL